MREHMFKKIDCVMIRVANVAAAERFYTQVFGLRTLWRDAASAGLVFPDSDAEIVLHSSDQIPHKVEVHYLVDDVVGAAKVCAENGCRILEAPFDVPTGKCAVIEDPFGTTLCLIDLTSGRRPVAQ